MALIVTAPSDNYSLENEKNLQVFLAGGITGCDNWQKQFCEDFKDLPGVTIYNPRRENFPIDDPNAAEEQITWEYNKLKQADLIVMWFTNATLQPICLYEMGRWVNSSDTPAVVGIEDGYKRTQDVLIQTSLSRPDINFARNWEIFKADFKNMVSKVIGERKE